MTDKLITDIFIYVESPLHCKILNKDLALSRDGDLERCKVLTIMNYQRIHDAIIERAKNRTLTGYKERHHIIPRCIGGTDEKSNLIDLTAREHFIIHKLLCEIYPKNDKIFFAYRMMAVMKNSMDNERSYYISSKEFERIRLLANEKIGTAARGRKLPPRPQEVIDKQQKTRKLNGYRHSAETKIKMSNTAKGRKFTEEHRKNLSMSLTNNPKVTGRAATAELELERRRKIKESWKKRKGGLHD